jgi:bifunctional DNA-binding transcriptional regulator/antitoxin component of YhaV-PrlF toxin-antitoxin module
LRYAHKHSRCTHGNPERPTINARAHHGTSSLDISIPIEITKAHNIHPGDVFEVTTTDTNNEFRITYKRVLTNYKNQIAHTLKQNITKRKVWVCSCGYVTPKKGAELSGYAAGSRGFHVHCPKCGRVVAEYLNKK